MTLNADEKNVYDSIKSSYPCGIRKWSIGGNLNDFDEVRSKVVYAEADMVKTAAKQLIVQTAEGNGKGLRDWEYFLKIPINPFLSDAVRRAQILAKLAGAPCTIGTLKRILKTIINNDAIDFDIFEYWTVTNDQRTIFWYAVVIYDSTFTYDLESIRSILTEIHPFHCDLSDVVSIDDFWEWDNTSLPLDDARYATGIAKMINGEGFISDNLVNTLVDSNAFKINGFVDSLESRYALYPRVIQGGGYAIKLNESKHIMIAGHRLNISDQIISIPNYNGVVLLYAYYDIVLKFGFVYDTDFVPGEPETYYTVLGQTDNKNIFAICEINLIGAPAEITQDLIKDVRCLF